MVQSRAWRRRAGVGSQTALVVSLAALLPCPSQAQTPGAQSLPAVVVQAPAERKKPKLAVRPSIKPPRVAASGPVKRRTTPPRTLPPVAAVASSAAATSGTGRPPPTGVIGQPPPAYAGGQIATGARVGLLGNQSFMQMPFSQTSYTSKYIDDQQARTLVDVLYADPSVRTQSFNTFENFNIRGFRFQRGDQAFDGLFGITNPYFNQIYGIERIEVLKGPSALLTGFPPGGSVGGVINFIPKRATDEPLTRVTTTYDSNTIFGTQFDVGRRWGDAKEWGARANFVVRGGDGSLDRSSERVLFGTLGLDYRGERFRASLDFGSQDVTLRAPIEGIDISAINARPRPPKPNINQAFSADRFFNRFTFGATRAEYDLLPDTTIGAAVGASGSNIPQGYTSVQVTDLAGNGTAQASSLTYQDFNRTEEIYLRSRFQTGLVQNKLAITATMEQEQAKDM